VTTEEVRENSLPEIVRSISLCCSSVLPAGSALYHLQIVAPYMRSMATLDKTDPRDEDVLGSDEALRLSGTLG